MSHRAWQASCLGTTILLLTALSACGSEGGDGAGGEQERSYASGEPLTVQNCGEDVTFQSPPERVMLLESAPVTGLDGMGVFDRVVARAGSFPAGYYSDDLAERIADVPSLSEDLDASGHLAISQEEIIAQSPDLVLGLPEGVTREGLADAGASTLIQELYCPSPEVEADFETLYWELERYGEIFETPDEAEELIADLRERVTAVEDATAGGEERTAAVLYPSVGGGPLYAYGSASMAQPQVEAAGFENVFADSSERVVEIQTEELVDRDPDVLILLYQGDEDGVADAVTSLPGGENITAVREGQVMTQLFNFTEPASPLNVTGLENIADRFGDD